MKKMFLVLMLILLISACAVADDAPPTLQQSETPDYESPVFIDTQTAAYELQSAYYGSLGWLIALPDNSEYMFAEFNGYLLRYNIADNIVDNAVKMSASYGCEALWSLTADGLNMLVYQVMASQGTRKGGIYLIDFANGTITQLADTADNFSLNCLPPALRDGFNVDRLIWDNNSNSRGISMDNPVAELDGHTIEYARTPDGSEFSLHAHDRSGNTREFPDLRYASVNNVACVVVDDTTIASLIPIDLDFVRRADLGYYKFVVIDIESGVILQEYPINTR